MNQKNGEKCVRVLLINNRPPYCGIWEYVSSLYHVFRKLLNDKVELLSWQSECIEKLYLKTREHYLLQYPEEALRVLSQLLFMFKIPRKYTVYHVTNSSLGILTKRIKPCVVTVHDLIPYACPRDLTDLLIQKSTQALSYSDMIICVSKNTKKDLLHYLDVNPNLVRVIYEGVDHHLFKPRDKITSLRTLGLPEDKRLVLHVGSEEPRKNIPLLIKAFHKFQRGIPDAILVRVGEKTEATQRLIDSLGLGNNVLYFKNVADLRLFYNAADLLVFPSYFEGFGFPLLQAMSSGCPVIASNNTSIPEVVGHAGILLSPFDDDGFAYWMYEICTNQELKARLIEEGLKRSQMFNWEKCACETLKVYEEIEDSNSS